MQAIMMNGNIGIGNGLVLDNEISDFENNHMDEGNETPRRYSPGQQSQYPRGKS